MPTRVEPPMNGEDTEEISRFEGVPFWEALIRNVRVYEHELSRTL